MPRPSWLLRLAAVLAPWALGLVLALWLLAGIAWGVLHGWIVPRIGEFRPQVEAAASRLLGAEVRIGAISAGPGWLLPGFELRDVVLRDAAGHEGLRLARVSAQLSPRALARRGLEQLVLDGPVLDLRRTADGRLLAAGIDLSGGPGEEDGRAADWIFSQRELVVRGATVRWTDEQRGLAPVELADAELVIRNGARSHRLRLDATPPADWGARFSLRADMRQSLLHRHRGDWRDWTGTVYADFPQVDLAPLRAHVDPVLLREVELQAGRGQLRAWADVVHGEVLGGQLDLALADAAARLGAGLEPLALASLQGRLRVRQLASGMEFDTEQLRFATADGAQWPEGDLFLSYLRGESRMPGQGELRAGRVDLAVLAAVAARLPLDPAWQAELAALAPRGRIEQLQARWTGRIEAPASYQAQGRVQDLALAAGPLPPRRPDQPHPIGRPGVAGLSAEFTLTEGGGQAQVALDDGALEFPGVFEEPRVPLDRLEGQLRWQHGGGRLALQVPELRFANADAAGRLQARWSRAEAGGAQPPGAGVLELAGTLERADGARVHRYLPLEVDAEARHYVRDAVQRGQASRVQFRVKGDLDRFPFADPRQGEFHIEADVQDVLYAYVPPRLQDPGEPPWPVLSGLAGRLVFDRNGMQVRNARGQLGSAAAGFAVPQVEAEIRDFGQPEVAVRAEGRGPLAAMLASVAASPVAQLTGGALDQAQGSGTAELRLQLALPLARLAASRAQGSVQLAGNDIRLRPDTPLLARTRGSVAFSDQGFALAGVQATVLGGEVRVDGGLQNGALDLRVQGSATAEGLRADGVPGALARLAQRASGGAAYTATLARTAEGALRFGLDSTLQGLALDLPAPLAKPADAAWPLHVALAPQAGGTDELSVRLADTVAARYVRDLSGAEPRVLRGAIGVGLPPGEAPALPAAGVSASVRLGDAPLDAWHAAFGAPAAAASSEAEAGYLPQRLALRADSLRWGSRHLHEVTLEGARDGGTWRADVRARELSGRLEYREGDGDAPGAVHARLARLVIAQGEEDEVTTLLDEQPASVPALDVVVEDFELRGRKLGRLEMQAENHGAEWQLHRLALHMPEARLEASGQWRARTGGQPRRTAMDFGLDVDDAGALLGRLGMPGVFRRGAGRLQGQVAWTGSPLALDYPSMSGQLHLDMQNGQFLKADAGPARLLGVLSLQALPRRLTLDFRDIFSAGFAFDFVRGDARIAEGVVSSNNLQMKGVNAAVLMDGRADIARETQDLRVVVVPEINAGTASLVATVINPAIGLGSFLAQWVLRRPLMEAATQQFHIDGTWSDPRIERVARSGPLARQEPTEQEKETMR
ncbi:YhdP family protein [Pseudorhodoferax sp.]|uniref:YhdP family protein n=1 Tax=Pseudorhodoferax sp. TaxID=1993553 RepID=UPI0039E58FB0